MTKGNQRQILLPALGMLVLILDTKTALAASAQGIQLCLQTLIPSLFPFFLFSNLLTAALSGHRFRPVERLLGMPQGSGGLFLIGLLGGYPVGAQSIAQAHATGSLGERDARRLLAFCSNAGPAFLFGVGARVFRDARLCWLIWGIHIFSSVITALLTPGGSEDPVSIRASSPSSFPQALKKSVETMGLVCGWVLIFRVMLGFLERWVLWLFPPGIAIILSGILELSNGCCRLPNITGIGLKLTLFSVFLGFGGLCVAMQTMSVAENLDTSLYLPAKVTQAAVSFLLSIPCQWLLPETERMELTLIPVLSAFFLCGVYAVVLRKPKIRGRNPGIIGV